MKGLNNEGLDIKKLSDPGDRYELGDVIGSGVYADVYKAFDNETNKHVAVKVVRYNKETREDVEEEYKILRDLSDHPNLPDFYGVYLKKSSSATKQDEIWFVMQLCEGGSVTELVRGLQNQNKRLSEIHIAFILRETLKALVHLHEFHVIHRDVKGSNILLTKTGEVKLVDFGIARELPSTLGKKTGCIGTPEWMAPEIVTSKVNGEAYDNRSDVWSLGMTAIELGDGKTPYHDMHPTRVLFQIVRNPPPTLYRPSNWTQQYNDFISECLVKNPEHRPYMNELIEHPFLTQLPENDFHMATELKVILETVSKVDQEFREVKIKLGALQKKDGEEPEALVLEDLSALEEVTEDSVVQHLETRFNQNQFYTYIGDVLLFLNPNKQLDIFNFVFQSKYKLKSRSQNEPHIFNVADSAYQDMLHHETDQNIVMTGETMSGKTQQFNMCLKQLVFLGQCGNKVGEKIQAAMDIIHAFGNASTPSNANSTRHILHAQITFTSTGKTSGAIFWLYQLEKWRVTTSKNTQGANYHIFYYLYDSLRRAETLNKYELDGNVPRYLARGGGTPNGIGGPREEPTENISRLERIESALAALSIDDEQRDFIWRALSAILLLGEIEFDSGEDDMAAVSNPDVVERISRLLKVEQKKMMWVLCNYCSVVEGAAVRMKHTVQEANRARHAFARVLYARLVDWIINLINLRLSFNRVIYGDQYCISLLDYFGFECFPKNGLEQLFVNSFNEQIHFFYNQKIFLAEMQEQMSEEVTPWRLQFHDNKGTIDEVMNKPHGVIYLLDEAAKTDQGYDFVNESLDSRDQAVRVSTETEETFSIAHYTGKVTYDGNAMVAKNRDLVPPELIEVMRKSTCKELKSLFTNKLSKTGNVTIEADASSYAPKINQTKKKWGAALVSTEVRKPRKFNTMSKGEHSQTKALRPAGSIFRATSLEILRSLAGGSTHFVHCLRASLGGQTMQSSLVRQQVRAQSIVDTASARKIGYSHRIPFNEFLKRYKFLAFDFDETVDETIDNCRLLLVRLKLEGYLMGKNKVFLKYYSEEYLSRLYETQVKKIVKVQAMMRAFLAKRTIATKQKSRQSSMEQTGNLETTE